MKVQKAKDHNYEHASANQDQEHDEDVTNTDVWEHANNMTE